MTKLFKIQPLRLSLLITVAACLMFLFFAFDSTGDDDTRLNFVNRLQVLALSDGNLGEVRKQLNQGADPNFGSSSTERRTPVHVAAEHGSVKVLSVLLQAGGNCCIQVASIVFDAGSAPLHFAAKRIPGKSEAKSIASIQTLLKHGAKPNVTNTDGNTPLHLVAEWHSSPSGVRALLESGANPNETNEDEDTPLHRSVASISGGSPNIIKALLDGGAKPNVLNAAKMTPLLLGVTNLSNDSKAITVLLQSGAEPNRKDPQGNTPLHIAVKGRKEEVIKALLAGGADPCIKDAKSYLPIQHAHEPHIKQILDRAKGSESACNPQEIDLSFSDDAIEGATGNKADAGKSGSNGADTQKSGQNPSIILQPRSNDCTKDLTPQCLQVDQLQQNVVALVDALLPLTEAHCAKFQKAAKAQQAVVNKLRACYESETRQHCKNILWSSIQEEEKLSQLLWDNVPSCRY